MKPETPNSKNVSKDLETFESLPAKTKDLTRLKEEAEKSDGPRRKALDETISRKSEGGR